MGVPEDGGTVGCRKLVAWFFDETKYFSPAFDVAMMPEAVVKVSYVSGPLEIRNGIDKN
jgi:hypothetical protein